MRIPGSWQVVAAAVLGLVGQSHGETETRPDRVFAATYVHAPGAPVTTKDTLAVCDPDGRFVLVVENGPRERTRISSGAIAINGRPVVSPADLNQRVALVERPLRDLRSTNTVEVRLAGPPGGAITIKVLGWQTCIRITTPLTGSTVHDPAIVVEGEFRTPRGGGVTLETTVTMGGNSFPWPVPAAVSGGRFAARVTLTPGENRLVARVTDDRGRSVEAPLSLTFEPDPPDYDEAPAPDIRPTSGFAPLAVIVTASEAAEPTVIVVDLDVDGDGHPDFALPDFAAPPHQVTYTYAAEGLYVASLTIRDQTGLTRVARVPIHVIPVPDLGATWGDFRRALARGDTDGALQFVAVEARERYRRVLDDLRPDLPRIAAALGALAPQVVTADYATASVTHGGAGGLATYLVTFVRDGDGVWRIASL